MRGNGPPAPLQPHKPYPTPSTPQPLPPRTRKGLEEAPRQVGVQGVRVDIDTLRAAAAAAVAQVSSKPVRGGASDEKAGESQAAVEDSRGGQGGGDRGVASEG